MRIENDGRDLIDASSSMTVAASNLRIQVWVAIVGVLALIATAGSIWIGIKAMH